MNLFDKETEDNQQEQLNISCKVEEQHEEVKEEPEEEEQKKDKTLSIEELKEILYYYATFNLPWFSSTWCV